MGACVSVSFLFMAAQYSTVWLDHVLFVLHLLMDAWVVSILGLLGITLPFFWFSGWNCEVTASLYV